MPLANCLGKATRARPALGTGGSKLPGAEENHAAIRAVLVARNHPWNLLERHFQPLQNVPQLLEVITGIEVVELQPLVPVV